MDFVTKSFRKDETLSSWTLLQHICPHFWAWLLNTIAIMPKSEDKYVEKVFNWSEFHLFEMTCYKIHTLVLPTLQYSKLHNILGFKPSNFSYSNLKNWRKQDDSKITPVYYNFTINGFEQKIRLQEDRLTSLLSNMNSDVRLQLATKMICTYLRRIEDFLHNDPFRITFFIRSKLFCIISFDFITISLYLSKSEKI